MTVRTLAEAAAEVLAKRPQGEPTKTLATWTDLGGSTHDDPTGGDIGKAAAGMVGKTVAPGKPAPNAPEPMKTLARPAASSLGSPMVTHNDVATMAEEEEVVEDDTILEAGPETDEDDEELDIELTPAELEEAYAAKIEMMREKIKSMSGMQEDIAALFGNEELSEEFKKKAATVYEAAVIARAVAVVEAMEAEILAAAEETINEVKQELEEQVDSYLNYMVEEWVNENEVAIEESLKQEVVENFMLGLKDLFIEHNIEVPEDKVDVVEAMEAEIAELEAKLNDAINENIELAEVVAESVKASLINSVCEGLTATQAEKVKTLAEGVEFTTEGEYAEKVRIIRESYVTNSADSSMVKAQAKSNIVALTESESAPVQFAEVSPLMDRYVNAISRTLAK